MKRYPEYKASGMDWIGEIPKHWVAKKLRYFCSMKSGNGFSHDLQGRIGLEIPFFKVADTNTPENKLEMLYAQNTVSSQDVSDFKFILHKPNSIVFPKVGAALLLNKRNILTQKSCIDNNMMSLYSNQSNPKFLYYAMLNVDFKRHYRIGGTVPSINESEVGNIPIAYPTHSEQTQIANFLDRKTGQIDELIHIKERRIELLQEQRTTLINQAVTKGLDPNVEMKPSRVEWIGDIPRDWSIMKVKYLTHQIIDGTHYTPEYQDSGIPFLRVTDIHTKTIDLAKVKYITPELHQELTQRCKPEKGNLLLSKNGTIGITRVIDWDFEFSIFVSLCLIKFRTETYSPHFFSYLFQSQVVDQQLKESSKTSTVTNLHLDKIRELFVVKPPLSEQTQIINFLDLKTKQIDDLISTEQRKIQLLKEYRQSLISEAVTGKIDVRNEV